MAQDLISAEVVPVAGRAVEAAKALQKLGFQVLHVADTGVSVRAPEDVWRAAVPVPCETRSRPRGAGSRAAPGYKRPVEDPVPIPLGLRDRIASVAVVEPPEFF